MIRTLSPRYVCTLNLPSSITSSSSTTATTISMSTTVTTSDDTVPTSHSTASMNIQGESTSVIAPSASTPTLTPKTSPPLRRQDSNSTTGGFSSASNLDVANSSTDVNQYNNYSSNASIASNMSKQSVYTTMTSASSMTVPSGNTKPSMTIPSSTTLYSSNTAGTSKNSLHHGAGFAAPPNTFIGSPMMIAFGEYLLVPTLDAYILIYTVTDFFPTIQNQYDEDEEDLNESENTLQENVLRGNDRQSLLLLEEQQRILAAEREYNQSAIEPIHVIGPFHVMDIVPQNINESSSAATTTATSTTSNIPASIVAITCTPLLQQNKHYVDVKLNEKPRQQEQDPEHEEAEIGRDTFTLLGYIAIVTSEGDVHIISMSIPSPTQQKYKSLTQTSTLPCTHILTSFHSGSMTATCISLVPQDDINSLQFLIGYDCGKISSFSIPLTFPPSYHNRNNVNDTSSTRSPHSCIVPEMIWSGTFQSPICSLSIQGRRKSRSRNHGKDHVDNDDENKKRTDRGGRQDHLLLLVGLSQLFSCHVGIQSCLEVVDMDMIEEVWKKCYSGPGTEKMIPLDTISLWPRPGTEIKDFHRNGVSKRNDTVDADKEASTDEDTYVTFALPPYDGTLFNKNNGRLSTFLHAANIIQSFHGNDSAFTVSFTDGTVAIMHRLEEEENVQYGISNDYNQYMIASPCIGMGKFDDSDVQGSEATCLCYRNSIACCSRGGTVVIVPVTPLSSEDKSPNDLPKEVTMYLMPYDSLGSDDGLLRYVQGFTAGYVRIKTWKSTGFRVEPLLFQAWAGGIINVYSCEVSADLHGSNNERRKSLFDMLLDNSTIHDLVQLLITFEQDETQEKQYIGKQRWDTSHVQKARQECFNAGSSVDEIVHKMSKSGLRDFDTLKVLLSSLMPWNQ